MKCKLAECHLSLFEICILVDQVELTICGLSVTILAKYVNVRGSERICQVLAQI